MTSVHTLQALMIDDDLELASLVAELFRREGLRLNHEATRANGLKALQSLTPDVLLLDWMLPDGNGLDLCRQVRQQGLQTPILMLTAKGDPIDKVLGLELGADDYMTKPFDPRELIARVRALARRAGSAQQQQTRVRFAGLELDLLARRASHQQQTLALTSAEFKLLWTLASQPGLVVSREVLNAAIQPGSYMPLDRAVDVQIGRLRKKLMLIPDGGQLIETVRGEGYTFTGQRL